MARTLTVIFGALVLSGCGMHFVGAGARALPPAWQSIAVPTLEDRTAEGRLGLACTRALQDRLSAGGREVGPSPEGADLVLWGSIDSVEEVPLAFESAEAGEQLVEVEIKVEISLVASEGGVEIWRREGLSGWRVFAASGVPADVEAARREAVVSACEEAALEGASAFIDALWSGAEVSSEVGEESYGVER